MLELIPLITITTVVFFITYIVGLIFYLPFFEKKEIPAPISFFIRTAMGYMAIPTIYSLYFTGGYTIFSGFFILYLIVFFLVKKKWPALSIICKSDIKYLLSSTLVLSTLVLFQCWRYGFFDEIYFQAYMQDSGIYATVSEYLKITGIETPSPWYQLTDVAGDGIAKIYHFEDFWFFALILDFLPERPLDLFNYVFSPVLGTIHFFASLALLTVLQKNKKNRLLNIFLALGSIVFIMYIPIELARWSAVLHINIMTYPKVAAVPILLPFALIGSRYQIKYIGALAFGFIILSDPLFLPTVLGASVIYYSGRFYINHNREELANIALIGFAAIYFFVFHMVFGSLENSSNYDSTHSQSSYLYGFFKNITISTFRHLIFFSPAYLAIAFFFLWCRNQLSFFEKETLSLVLLTLGFASLTWGIMNKNFGSFQFDTSVQTVLGAMLLICCIVILQNI
ncbi:MAG: hypothetical protein AAFZ15_31340, partial [Bacteroidota bacterium]